MARAFVVRGHGHPFILENRFRERGIAPNFVESQLSSISPGFIYLSNLHFSIQTFFAFSLILHHMGVKLRNSRIECTPGNVQTDIQV